MVNLFCFPFAGGNKYSYRELADYCPPAIQLIPVELPGRGARFREPPLTELYSIIDDLFGQIRDQLQPPYAFYGHSMGTWVSYLLTKKILQVNLPPPSHLFLTGCAAPSVPIREVPRHQLPKAEFIEKLRSYGGSPEEVLNDSSLMDFFEPILRADFQALETYAYQATSPFSIPVSIIIGTEDRVTYEDALAWQRETTEPVEIRQFPGDHFFIFGYKAEIMKIMVRKLMAVALSPSL